MHDGPTRQAQRQARARDDVPGGRRPRRLERRQRAGDVVLHDQRRGRVADQAPARARGDRAACARSRRAGRTAPRTTGCRSPTRSSARSTTSASTFPREWPYYLGWNGQHSNAPGTTCFLPVVDNTRQYINVLLILLSEPHGKVPLFIDDWSRFKPSNAMEWAAWAASKIGLVDPIPYQPIGGLKRARGGFVVARHAGAAGLADDGAHRLRGALPDAEPDAHRRGAAPRRLGPRRADDPARLEARPGHGPPRPRLPRVQRQDVRLALEALAAGARLAAQLRRHRRRARGPVPAVRHRHGRGRRPGARGEVRRGRHLRRRRGLRAGLQGQGDGRDLHEERRPPAGRGDRVHEGDLPLPGGHLRALPGAHRRVPPARASGCSSRTWRSSTTSASATRRTRAARPRARRSGTAR